MSNRLLRALALLYAWASYSLAGEARFEGVATATLIRGGTQANHFQFTRKGNLLRIENTDNKLEPINVIDLEAKKLTIVYPHNTTFVTIDLTRTSAPPGNAPPINLPIPPAATPAKVGPAVSPAPGFPTPPTMPSIPQLPSQSSGMPGMPNPAAAGPPMQPRMGSMPAMMPPPPGGGFGAAELKKTEQTKKVQGLDCTLYTLNQRGEKFELWVTNDSALFPFRLIERDFFGRRFGPRMLEETWPELLRDKSLFPLEASWKMEPGSQERLSFKVEKMEKKKIEDTKLFEPPEKYIEIRAPQL